MLLQVLGFSPRQVLVFRFSFWLGLWQELLFSYFNLNKIQINVVTVQPIQNNNQTNNTSMGLTILQNQETIQENEVNDTFMRVLTQNVSYLYIQQFAPSSRILIIVPFCSQHKVENYIAAQQIVLCAINTRVSMSYLEKQESSQQIQWNEDQLEQFFQCQHDDWMPYNSSQINITVREYGKLFSNIGRVQTIQTNQKTFSNNQHFRQRQEYYKNSNLGHQIQLRVHQNPDDQKIRLTQKIQAILARRNTPTIQQNKNISRTDTRGCIRRKRAVITREIIEKATKFFQLYNHCYDKPLSQRITFREVAFNLGVSVTEIKKLYEQYSQNPLFLNRMKKFKPAQNNTLGSPGTYSYDLN